MNIPKTRFVVNIQLTQQRTIVTSSIFFIPMTRVTKQRFSLMHHEFLLGELIIYEGVLAVGDKCTAKNFDDVQILMIFCVFMSWIRIKKQ